MNRALSTLSGAGLGAGLMYLLDRAKERPSTSLLFAGMAGGALVGYSLTRLAPLACVVGSVGLALLGGGAASELTESAEPGGARRGQGSRRDMGRTLHEDFLASRMS